MRHHGGGRLSSLRAARSQMPRFSALINFDLPMKVLMRGRWLQGTKKADTHRMYRRS